MVFLPGTAIMHSSAAAQPRAERASNRPGEPWAFSTSGSSGGLAPASAGSFLRQQYAEFSATRRPAELQ